MHTKAFPYIGLLSLFWGTNVVASRFGVGEFAPLTFIVLRLWLATLFFLPVWWWQQNGRFTPNPELWRKAIISSLLGVAIPMTTFVLALQYLSSGMASIFVTTAPAQIVLAAHFLLPDEKLTRNKTIGVVLALVGALFLALRGESGLAGVSRANPLGFILVTTGLVAETINTVYVRRHMTNLDPLSVTGIRLGVAAVVMSVVVSLVGGMSLGGITAVGYFSVTYAALIGALAGQFTAFYIQRRFGATAFALTSYLIPVVATTFGVLLLGEIITWAMLIGVTLIGGGIYLINRRVYEPQTALAGS